MSADAPSRIHLWSGLIVLGVFLAGAAAGAGLMTWLRPHPPGPHHARGPGALPPPMAALGLSPEQQAQAWAIMERHRAEFEAVVKESFPRLRALQDEVDQELLGILTEAQAKEFEAQKARRPRGPEGGARGFPGMPGGPPGPGPGGPPMGGDGAPPPR